MRVSRPNIAQAKTDVSGSRAPVRLMAIKQLYGDSPDVVHHCVKDESVYFSHVLGSADESCVSRREASYLSSSSSLLGVSKSRVMGIRLTHQAPISSIRGWRITRGI